jgi:hypothetical protein
MNAFGLGSKQYYSFDYVNAHVLTMSSEISFNKGLLGFSSVHLVWGSDPKVKDR